jgi:hypothetical protein
MTLFDGVSSQRIGDGSGRRRDCAPQWWRRSSGQFMPGRSSMDASRCREASGGARSPQEGQQRQRFGERPSASSASAARAAVARWGEGKAEQGWLGYRGPRCLGRCDFKGAKHLTLRGTHAKVRPGGGARHGCEGHGRQGLAAVLAVAVKSQTRWEGRWAPVGQPGPERVRVGPSVSAR